jgi:UDPglucose--hexose-1-phosphate uridylyltransferase
MTARPHRRMNLLTGDWVLVSPHRLSRPWQGEVAQATREADVVYDPDCYLCPGNTRAAGAVNPAYDGVFAFDNDYPALLTEGDAPPADALLRAEPETGVCRVLCYAPEHHLTMARLGQVRTRAVIDAWADQYADLACLPDIGAVTVFENRGAMMGASNPHPHGQIWATRSVPNELAREDAHQRRHFETTGRALLTDYVERELDAGERIVFANDHFVTVTPFWASWPFETLIAPRRAVATIGEMTAVERDALAETLCDITGRYDRLFDTSFPYTMGWHQKPVSTDAAPHFVAHAHFYPPLLRSATVRKHMVGFEMLAMPQRDLTPETAAARLRAV